MANKNKKISKIKSTKVNKDEYKHNLDQGKIDQKICENQNINSNEQTTHFESKNEHNYEKIEPEQKKSDPINQTNESINQQVNSNHQEHQIEDENKTLIIEKLALKVKELEEKNKILTEENNKAKIAFELERKQFITKLEEKAQLANKMIDEKKHQLENEKQEELKALKDAAYIDTISSFLEPILLFEQTIRNSPNNPVIQSYIQGYTMIASMFNEKLNNLGVEEIDVNVGDEFNENFMEAFDVEHVDNMPPNKVLKVVSKGFVYKAKKVIKFTSVIVSK